MADVAITGLPASSGLSASDLVEVVDDPGGSPVSQKATFTQVAAVVASAGGLVVGPASAVDDNIATFDTTTGKLIQDSGTSISDLTTSIGTKAAPSGSTTDGNLTQFGATSTVLEDSGIAAASVSGHIANTSNPHSVTLTQVGGLPADAPIRSVTTDTTITATDSGGVVILSPPTSTDLTATLDSSLPLGFQVLIVRGGVGAGKGRVLLADNSGGTISFAPKTQLVSDSDSAMLKLGYKSGTDRAWLASGPPSHYRAIVLTTDTTLDDYHSGAVIYVTTSSADVTLTVADAVSEGWECIVWREGATYDVIIEGESTMSMSGPAAAEGTVTIGVDEGCVSLMRRSASKTMAVGVIT